MSALPNSATTSSGNSSSNSSAESSNKNSKAQATTIPANNDAGGDVVVVVADTATVTTTSPTSTPSSTAGVSSSTNTTDGASQDTVASKPYTAPRSGGGGGRPTTVTEPDGQQPPKATEFRHNKSNTGDTRQRSPYTGNLPDLRQHYSKTNLYIRGLRPTTKDQDLHDMCNRFGHISSTKAIINKATGLCRGYGFVEFVSEESAKLAEIELEKSGIFASMAKISSTYSSPNSNQHHSTSNHHNNNNSYSQYNNHKLNKNAGYNNIHINSGSQHNHSSSSHKNHADPTNLYIANLPPNMSEPELEELLSNYGNIVSTRILRDESNNPRGVGFARMESRDKCEEIIEQLNGRPYKGSSESLVVKFADGGNRKRHYYNNHQHHSNNNNNHHNHLAHHNHHKVDQDDSRCQDNTDPEELGAIIQNHDHDHHHHHQGTMSHSNQPPDLAMMGTIRMQPGYPPSAATGGHYPPPLGSPSGAPQWIHPAGGQPYVVPTQMTQAGGLSPSSQAAAAMHYGHIPHLAAQMQGLQITHAPPHVGGYLPPQHQWPALWSHPIPQQSPSPMGRLSAGPMQTGPVPAQISGQIPSQLAPVQHQSPQINQSQPQRLAGQQPQSAAIDNKLHVSVPM